MTKTVLISQSNYIPWKGYFDLIKSADDFVVYDEVQYTRRDWRNRNQIKTAHGLQWLTLPVQVKGRFTQRIDEVELSDETWRSEHWKSISHAYARAEFFDLYRNDIASLYESACGRLTDINVTFLKALCRMLDIGTRFHSSPDFAAPAGVPFERTQRLVDICVALGATEYLTGPAAKAYLDETRFAAHGISVRYYDYSGYPEYRQLHGPFVHAVSVLDLLLNEGPDSPKYMKSHSETELRTHAAG